MQTSLWCGCTLNQQNKVLANLQGCALSMQIAAIKSQYSAPLVLLCMKSSDVPRLEQELSYLCPQDKLMLFRDYETLPYDILSPHQDIISSRIEFLSQAPLMKDGIIITSLSAVMQRLCPLQYIASHSFILHKGESYSLEQLRHSFAVRGYLQVQQVLSHGEFAVRGSLIDVFPMGMDLPLRIDFFDDEVESISYFDVQTQRSIKQIDNVDLLPANEFPLSDQDISAFRTRFRNAFARTDFSSSVIYQAVSKGTPPAGIEYYLPLFFESTSSFFDYISKDSGFVLIGSLEQALEDYSKELQQRHDLLLGNLDHPPLPVAEVFFTPDEITSNLSEFKQITLLEQAIGEAESTLRGRNNAPTAAVPNIAFDRKDKNHAQKFIDFALDFCQKQHGRILITALSEGRRQSLRELLPQSLIKALGLAAASNMEQFLNTDSPLMLTIAPFDQGVILQKSSKPQTKEAQSKGFSLNHPLAILTETELLGFKVVRQRRKNQHSHIDQDAIIKNLTQLNEGQLVVHIDHGIGIYRGLKTEKINNVACEFLTIEYLNGDMLNIPITALNKIARYSGEEHPTLSQLGTDKWTKRKNKAAQKVLDVAAELLDIYAQRQVHQGFAFTVDEHELEDFTSAFPYEETEDQQQAIDQTLADMQKPFAMDRLICGDVGFGKTEVALRAAFVAASNGKQVALLAPTTILAEQHFQNFSERFASTGIIVEMLSRFRSTSEQKRIMQALEEGKIDIIIGTHRLLSSKMKFKDLGLLIIDEEHRFGVRQKEKLKAMRAEVDLLTLTATPIPRTLNMALEGMRELSIIATPPEHRLAVKTFIYENSDQLCREAIMRELRRGGQVYYLHNDVASMDKLVDKLTKLVPEAKIEMAHGQMDEQHLQKVMQDFCHQRFNVLVCSTIIENGLDIPTANTIIIDRADLLGLAQLHQIRGRVGRSHHQAYAYLFTPPKSVITKEAKQRLDALSSIDELGAGFVLASHDLEIRGAGELLGEEQSGQIESIGFSLYMEMLNTAVKALKDGRAPSLAELTLNGCDINMQISTLLPESYIDNVNTRLSLYKRIASCESFSEFDDLKIEIIDRFGSLPVEAQNLFTVSRLKYMASKLGIAKIRGDHTGAVIEFEEQHKIDPAYLIKLVQMSRHNEYQVTRANALRYNLPETEKNPRLSTLSKVLNALKAHSSIQDETL